MLRVPVGAGSKPALPHDPQYNSWWVWNPTLFLDGFGTRPYRKRHSCLHRVFLYSHIKTIYEVINICDEILIPGF